MSFDFGVCGTLGSSLDEWGVLDAVVLSSCFFILCALGGVRLICASAVNVFSNVGNGAEIGAFSKLFNCLSNGCIDERIEKY